MSNYENSVKMMWNSHPQVDAVVLAHVYAKETGNDLVRTRTTQVRDYSPIVWEDLSNALALWRTHPTPANAKKVEECAYAMPIPPVSNEEIEDRAEDYMEDMGWLKDEITGSWVRDEEVEETWEEAFERMMKEAKESFGIVA